MYPGKVHWVNNSAVLPKRGVAGVDASGKGTYLNPYRTIDDTVGRCTAGRGDIIAVMPGYTQTITAAAGITSDVDGVAIVGLGNGSLRPQISMEATAATHVVTGTNNAIVNMSYDANFLDITECHNVSGTADNLYFENVHWTEGGTGVLNYLNVVDVATGCNDLHFSNCSYQGSDAQNNQWLNGVAGRGLWISDCYIGKNVGEATAQIDYSGAVTEVWIKDSFFRSNVDAAVQINFVDGSNLGLITNCWFSSLDVAGALTTAVEFTGGHVCGSFFTGEADKYGIIGGGAAIYANL